MKQKPLIILVVIIAAVALAYWLFRPQADDQASAAGAGGPYGGGGAVAVTSLTLQEATIELNERLPGRTSAYKVAEIRPQVSGIIIERSFVEGGNVEQGQQLYQIDPATYEAAYESAKADLQRANANVKSVRSRAKRYAELVEIKAVSQQEYDDIKASLAQAEADIAVAQANVTQAKINLDYTKVYAPISGRIGKSAVTEGALVTANQQQSLTKITQLDPIYVDMTQSSTELIGLRRQMGGMEEMPVTLRLEDGSLYEQQGALQFSDITVDETTGSVQLRALFPNPDRLLLPGMFVSTSVHLGEQRALLVPQKAAIRDAEGGLSVWVIGDDNTVNPRPITAQSAYLDQWVVADGVQSGEMVVLEGFQKIQPGVTVAPTSAEPTSPATPAPATTEREPAEEGVPQAMEAPAGENVGQPSETIEAVQETPEAVEED